MCTDRANTRDRGGPHAARVFETPELEVDKKEVWKVSWNFQMRNTKTGNKLRIINLDREIYQVLEIIND